MSADAHGGGGALVHHEEHEEHEEHVNHEAWVIPYADLLTLLMALFIVLWATSSQNEAKFAAAAESIREAFSSGTGEQAALIADGTSGIMDGQQTGVEGGDYDQTKDVDPTTDAEIALLTKQAEAYSQQQAAAAAAATQQQTFASVQQQIADHAATNGLAEAVSFRQEERGLVVSIVTDNVLFDSGAADLKPQGQSILAVVAQPLKNISQSIMVEGHTDNSPINTARYPTNWELSSQRGTSVLRFMTETQAFDPNRIASAGYADTKPIAANDNPAGKAENRRVEIVVLAAK